LIKERDVSMNEAELKDIDKAYLAGLFDGEGCANATFRTKKKILHKKTEGSKILLGPHFSS